MAKMVDTDLNEQNNSDFILVASDIKKSFNNVEVLHGVDFTLKRGEVHGIVGQNGAGKSTLMKIINGVYTRDKGTIAINGEPVNYDSPIGANKHGISMVYQEFSLVPSMPVMRNLFLAHEDMRGPLCDDSMMREKARKLFKELEVNINPDAAISQLSVGERQIVEIAKAISHNASVLIMDEPTSSLSSVEINSLFSLIHRLKKDGISIIFVSHHLNEVIKICDRVTVIRDGNVALAKEVKDTNLEEVITAMIGKKIERNNNRGSRVIDRSNPLLEVKGLSSPHQYTDISFNLFPGEILGIAGVLGSGRTELLKSLFGIIQASSGSVFLDGKKVNFHHPADAIESGLMLVPEDRRKMGLVLGGTVRTNVLLPIWKRLVNFLFIRDREGTEIVNQYVKELNIKTTGIQQVVQRLSGGNQQKVVFAKSMACKPKILMLDDPTVGVDIETKKEVANIIHNIAASGDSVLLVSSEMDELATICDRILVFQRGRIVEEIDCQKTPVTEEVLMKAIQGVVPA
jgi:ribose transport system ATP-binding protein